MSVPQSTDVSLLFVYGSLRRGLAFHHHLRRLGVRFVAEAKVAGELVDLGKYPGARRTHREGKWVYGELFQLHHPDTDLRVLDKVEEIIPPAPERSEFLRTITETWQSDGKRRQAWIYWLNRERRFGRPIPSGDYAR